MKTVFNVLSIKPNKKKQKSTMYVAVVNDLLTVLDQKEEKKSQGSTNFSQ